MTDWVTVRVAATRGSVPREVGAEMRIYADHQSGTIGGGRLEFEASAKARAMLGTQAREEQTYSLGPNLGQCCGGAVTLTFEAGRTVPEPAGPPIWVWGAGHVGRAIVSVLAPLGQHPIVWVDDALDRFPGSIPEGAEPLVAADPLRVVARAPAEAKHIILTYSHDLDLGLCGALLTHGFGDCGLIGSATKWARFRKRLAEAGHAHAEIDRILCPIGDPSLGKHPQAIAVGVVTGLLSHGTLGLGDDIRE